MPWTALLLTLSLPPVVPPQQPGGLWETHYRFDGEDSNDFFGSAVAGVGDTDGDGWPDFLVGSRYTTVGGSWWVGTAYLYSGRDGSLLRRIDGDPSRSFFAGSLDGVGDVDGDGHADYMISDGGSRPGHAYVYSGRDGSILVRVRSCHAGGGRPG